MQHFPINVWALVAATFAKFFFGWLWYSPILFGKPWMALVGCTPEEFKKNMPKAIVGDLLSTFIQAFVLVHAVYYAGAHNAAMGAGVGFFNWLGFVAVTTFGSTLYEKRPFKLFLINNGFQAISIIGMGAILGVWGAGMVVK